MFKVYDNADMIEGVKEYTLDDGTPCIEIDVSGEVADETDLVLFLREEQFPLHQIDDGTLYCFNSYCVSGTALIGVIEEYENSD
jgi:hypothetical protein